MPSEQQPGLSTPPERIYVNKTLSHLLLHTAFLFSQCLRCTRLTSSTYIKGVEKKSRGDFGAEETSVPQDFDFRS
jgi:hypothetical protein